MHQTVSERSYLSEDPQHQQSSRGIERKREVAFLSRLLACSLILIPVFQAFGGPLEIPTNVRLLITGTNQASVMWVDNATGETGYEIQRRTGDTGTWTLVQSPAADATSWTDNAVPANNHVYYRVRTKNGTSGSAYSNVACLTNPGDSDADGIPDTAEVAAGLDPSDWKDATADLDGDGVPNAWEYALSTDMTDDASKPAPNITVDPSVVTETATVKRTIHNAITALPNNVATPPYSIVAVKPGVYEENISVASGQRVAILSDGSGVPPEIRGYSPHFNRNQVVEILGDAVIDGFRITRKSGDRGFGMMVWPGAARRMARVANCAISGQQYPNGMATGTGIVHNLGRLVVSHSTIFGNTRSGGQGAGLYSNTSHLETQAVSINSIYWNAPSGTTSEIYHNGSVVITNCIVRNGAAWGAITSDPILNPLGHLTGASPAVGAGSVGHGAPWDIHVEARDSSPDIGADEFIDVDVDGIPDRYESGGDLQAGNDDDGDGLSNIDEHQIHASSPIAADSDGDGLSDGDEVMAGTSVFITDTDDDGIPDGYEFQHGLNPLSLWDRLGDADGDRIPNLWEYKRGTSASNAASKPATDWIVSPPQAGTGIYKATIQQAINAVLPASGSYAIIEVRPGSYSETVATSHDRRILLLADRQTQPVEILAPSGGPALNCAGEAVIDGFRIAKPFNASGTLQPGVKINADYKSITLPRVQTKLVNCIITGHSYSLGGGIYLENGRLTVEHCTIAGNEGSGANSANGIYVGGNSLHLANSVVWNPTGQATSEVYKVSSGQVLVTNCIIRGGEHGSSNADPLLNPRGLLTASSPAVDAGALGFAGYDFQGESRSTAPDLGADEFLDADLDGLPDWVEAAGGATNPTIDTDSDGLDNLTEYEVLGTHAHFADTDGDGLNDGGEAAASSNPYNQDTDADVMPDGYEVLHGLDPLDHRDALADEDGDRIPNVYEWANNTSASSSASFPAANFTVDPSATVTATIKNTITAAVTAANSTTPDYKIIFVKSGAYAETINITTRTLLILGEKGFTPPRLTPNTDQNFVVLNKNHAMLDGFDISGGQSLTGSTGVFAGSVNCRIVNCRIRDHRSATAPAIHLIGTEMAVVNCLIHSNESSASPSSSTKNSGIYIFGGNAKLHLINSIVWNEKDSGTVPQIATSSGSVQADHSIVLGGQFGAINVNPMVEPVFGMLRPTSLAIDAGTTLLVGTSATDFQNELRGANPDIGLDEWMDTDSDGLPDSWEQHFYSNLTYQGTDDVDGDGLTFYHEFRTGCNPTDPDTDDDGLTDLTDELTRAVPGDFVDSDADGLADDWEQFFFGSLTPVGTDDPDGDGLQNYYELRLGCYPTDTDTDNDGITDLIDVLGTTGSILPEGEDTNDDDGDGLSNGRETVAGSNSTLADTNGDGISDGKSWTIGFSPISADTDGDGISNAVELAAGSSPLLADSDGDGVNDGADAFPLDSQASTMSPGSGDTTPPAVILTKPPGATLVP